LWFRQHQKPQALLLSITVFGAVITNAALKFLFARPRPEVFPPLVVETSYSFPSGHTTTAAAFYGMLAILLWQAHHRRWALLSGVWVFAVAFSRVYLGAHYPSDVLGSLALGTLWLVIASAVYWSYCRRLAANPTDLNRQSP
jgi:membrane-associated phospholipid phosphatase